MNKILFFLIGFFFVGEGFSQPVLLDLQDNAILTKQKTKSLRSTKQLDTLSLPFFDDFSQVGIYPDTTRWIDKAVFINNDLPDGPPSIGVASFDMLDSTGKVYSTANSSQFTADYLTSMPIDLDFPDDTSIALSFFYQPQGLGSNAPEESDSLVLQFYSPLTKEWASVWHVAGSENQAFRQVTIAITDSIYRQKGFQFRFFNYGSIADNSYASWAGNGDFWHLDWIYLDKNANHSILPDVSMTHNMVSFLTNFEAVPWDHFSSSLVNKQIRFSYQNHDTNTWNVGRHLQISEEITNTFVSNLNLGNENINPSETIDFNSIFNGNPFPNNSRDSANFLMKAYLQTDTTANRQRYRYNDTLRYHQIFQNYYAYDDGTAEAGIGLYGNGTDHAYMAYKFTPVKADTLRGAYIYFNRTYQNASQKYFLLTIWDDDNGKPGTVLFSKIGYLPKYTDSLNAFTLYLTDTAIFVDHTFYIGWQKTTEDMLNVGFDVNRDASDKLFYNINGTWEQSSFAGAMMVRPVLSEKKPLQIETVPPCYSDIQLYPNPAHENIYLKGEIPPHSTVLIYNTYGECVQHNTLSNTKKIDINNLPSGIYFLTIYNKQHQLTIKKKFIIVR